MKDRKAQNIICQSEDACPGILSPEQLPTPAAVHGCHLSSILCHTHAEKKGWMPNKISLRKTLLARII